MGISVSLSITKSRQIACTITLNAIRSRIGQEVPPSNRYERGQRANLVSVDNETAKLQFPNNATLAKVPHRNLVDDSGYWKP